MTTLITNELIKLGTTRTIRRVLLGALAIAAVLAMATVANADREIAAGLGSAESWTHILGVSGLPAFAMLTIGIMAMAGEYQHQTITQTFLVTPVRGRVVAAKMLALGVSGLVVAASVMAVAFLVALPQTWSVGLDVLDADVGRTVIGNLTAGALSGVLGVAIGALLRSQLAAVLLAIGWGLLAEGVISVLAGPGVGRWLPGGTIQSIVWGGDTLLPVGVAAAVLAGYAVVLATVATMVTVRRDVT